MLQRRVRELVGRAQQVHESARSQSEGSVGHWLGLATDHTQPSRHDLQGTLTAQGALGTPVQVVRRERVELLRKVVGMLGDVGHARTADLSRRTGHQEEPFGWSRRRRRRRGPAWRRRRPKGRWNKRRSRGRGARRRPRGRRGRRGRHRRGRGRRGRPRRGRGR